MTDKAISDSIQPLPPRHTRTETQPQIWRRRLLSFPLMLLPASWVLASENGAVGQAAGGRPGGSGAATGGAASAGGASGAAKAGAPASGSLPQLGKAKLSEVIAAMTLEEKAALLTGKLPPGVKSPADEQAASAPGSTSAPGSNKSNPETKSESQPDPEPDETAAQSAVTAPVIGQTQDKVPGAAGTTYAIPRLGIPSLVFADGPAGVRLAPERPGMPERRYFATAFPVATALASTWDLALVQKLGAAIGAEASAYGIDVLLAPALNLHRFPLGGRNFEYYAEDPLLSGEMAAAMVRGVQSQGVGTSLKHFAVNNHEWNRNTINVKVDARALRELYLKGFEIAVKAGRPWTVMSSYNRLNGPYTSEHPWLLQSVLREEWGFDGVVMSDWFGGRDAVAQMQAGNDLLMPGTREQQLAIIEAVRAGRLDEAVLDRNVARMLGLIQRSLVFRGYQPSDAPDLKAHAALAREVAAAGMVLLKNETPSEKHETSTTHGQHADTKRETTPLPLSLAASIALFGNSAYHTLIGGTGSGDVHEAYAVSLSAGLRAAGCRLDRPLARAYERHVASDPARKKSGVWHDVSPEHAPPWPERRVAQMEIEAAAAEQDLALISLGRHSGEFADRKIKDDFELSQTERDLLTAVSKAFRARAKPVVVVLNIGGVIETASWRELADAILLAWQPGQEAGHAITDVLLGKVNPSGRLPDSFAMKLADYPAAANFPGRTLLGPDPAQRLRPGEVADREAEIVYQDGIRVGYRAFNLDDQPVAYPFGYGLSYTRFSFEQMSVSHAVFDEPLTVSLRVVNTGERAGREVVQLYLSGPPLSDAPRTAPELRAFAKTDLLQPGESQLIRLTLGIRELVSFDEGLDAWVAPAGTYEVRVGASSRDIRQQASFKKASTTRITRLI